MNLKLPTFANYYYIFTCYWADPATSDDGATDEGSNCSLPDDAASGSAKTGATFTSNPTSRSRFAKGSRTGTLSEKEEGRKSEESPPRRDHQTSLSRSSHPGEINQPPESIDSLRIST